MRNVSPTIHGGMPLPSVEPMEKKAPTHISRDVPCETGKSPFEIGQEIVLEPKLIVMFTDVSHAGFPSVSTTVEVDKRDTQ